MDGVCPKQYAIPHGVKVFAAAFLLAKYLQKPKAPACECTEQIKILNKGKNLMEPDCRLAPYDYKLSTPNAPISSLELLMMLSKREYEIVNPPKAPPPNLNNVKIHYDYGQVYRRIKW